MRSYLELKSTYKATLKKYPEISNLFDGKCNITMIEKRFEKIGRKWSAISTQKKENYNYIYYCNCVDAIPFFKALGGTEKVTVEYTVAGKIPTQLTSISPDRNEKTVRSFIFEY